MNYGLNSFYFKNSVLNYISYKLVLFRLKRRREYSYKPISFSKKTAKSTAVATNIELASTPGMKLII